MRTAAAGSVCGTRLPSPLFLLLSVPTTTAQVNGRYIKKRIHVRIEHVSPSRCHEEFLRRCKENDEARHAAKVAGTPAPACKRVPKGPRTTGFTLENVTMETMTAVPYDILKVRKNGRDGGVLFKKIFAVCFICFLAFF